MKRRDYVAEILDKRSRLPSDSERWDIVARELEVLLDEVERINSFLETQDRSYSELIAYVPIRAVTVIEGYFRLVYASLVDYGDPYRANASTFELRFSIDTALSLERHSVTMGEFVSHLLTTNNLEDINYNMSKLMGGDFLAAVKAKYLSMARQLYIWDELEDRADAILLESIANLYRKRHILCHELAPPGVTPGEADFFIDYTTRFIRASELVIADLTPRTGA